MLKRKDLVLIRHTDRCQDWFPTTAFDSGASYFLIDRTYHGLCCFNGTPIDLSQHDRLFQPKKLRLIDQLTKQKSINSLYQGRCYGIETNDPRLKERGRVKCYVSSKKTKDRFLYLDNYNIPIEKCGWKVVTARTSAGAKFGTMLVARPDEVHTGSYISWRVRSEVEAESLKSYLLTNVVASLLSLGKGSRDISAKCLKFIPLVPLDRMWNDETVRAYLKTELGVEVDEEMIARYRVM